MQFRLVLQPLTSIFFAVRAGLRDAKAGRPPYLRAILTLPGQRRELLREGWKDVAKIFIIAVIIDVVYQIVAQRWIYPGEALLVAAILAFVPYVLLRELTAIARRKRSSRVADARAGGAHGD
jgi:hypothetical protein